MTLIFMTISPWLLLCRLTHPVASPAARTRQTPLDRSKHYPRLCHSDGLHADLLRQHSELAKKRLGLDAYKARWDLDLSLFKPPPQAGDQLRLL
jgi:hypothetical protein